MNKKLLVLILLIIIAAVAIAVAIIFTAAQRPSLITVMVGEEFTLKQGEKAALKDKPFTVSVIGFVNSPCPSGTQCIWSGQDVELEVTYEDKTYTKTYPGELPYKVLTRDSDYKTYAKLVILAPEKLE